MRKTEVYNEDACIYVNSLSYNKKNSFDEIFKKVIFYWGKKANDASSLYFYRDSSIFLS